MDDASYTLRWCRCFNKIKSTLLSEGTVMSRWMWVYVVVGMSSCPSAPAYKGVQDESQEIDAAGPVDAREGVDGAGEAEMVEDIGPSEDVGLFDYVGFDGEAGEVQVEDADVETSDRPEGWACLNDVDCRGTVGPLGPCEAPVCLDGECVVEQAQAGTPCEGDGNLCTDDLCDSEGKCVHEPITCQEPPDNECDGDTLVAYSRPGRCDRGECVYAKTEKACADGCTVSDGVAHCVGEDPCAGVDCSQAPFGCLKAPGSCEAGSCVFEYDDGVQCDDDDACTNGDQCAQGVCLGEPVLCETPPSPSCLGPKTLQTYALPGTCKDGECEYESLEVECEGGCLVDQDGVAGCVGQGGPCAGVDCTEAPSPCLKSPGVCVDGYCEFEVNDGASCEDGDKCTSGDVCEGGICVSGLSKDCDDGEVCTDDTCDPGTGQCVHTNNESPCDDGLSCTTDDVCSDGVCAGTPVKCTDPPPNECADFGHVKTWSEAGVCQEPSGECVYEASVVACPSGWCQFGYCTSEGMTVVGFFESGAGSGTGQGSSVQGMLGWWTEGGSGGDGLYTVSPGW